MLCPLPIQVIKMLAPLRGRRKAIRQKNALLPKKKGKSPFYLAFSQRAATLAVASVCCAEIERLRRAGEQTPEIHPSQSEAAADTLQRGTINKGIIQR